MGPRRKKVLNSLGSDVLGVALRTGCIQHYAGCTGNVIVIAFTPKG